MREIKFRGLTRGGQWLYGELFTIRQDGFTSTFIHAPFRLSEEEPEDPYQEVITSTVGQYLGIKDKKDKEIYEGDVVIVPSGFSGDTFIPAHLSEVVFGGDCWPGVSVSNPPDHLWPKDVFIIGNLHENSTLRGLGIK